MFESAGVLARNTTGGAQRDVLTMATKLKETVSGST